MSGVEILDRHGDTGLADFPYQRLHVQNNSDSDDGIGARGGEEGEDNEEERKAVIRHCALANGEP